MMLMMIPHTLGNLGLYIEMQIKSVLGKNITEGKYWTRKKSLKFVCVSIIEEVKYPAKFYFSQ